MDWLGSPTALDPDSVSHCFFPSGSTNEVQPWGAPDKRTAEGGRVAQASYILHIRFVSLPFACVLSVNIV